MTFKAGQSGNPGGRPRIEGLADVQALARRYTKDAINALVDVLNGQDVAPAARVAAAKTLLDRGYGMPKQEVGVNVAAEFLQVLASLGSGQEHFADVADQSISLRDASPGGHA